MLIMPIMTQDGLLIVTATIEIGGRTASSKQVTLTLANVYKTPILGVDPPFPQSCVDLARVDPPFPTYDTIDINQSCPGRLRSGVPPASNVYCCLLPPVLDTQVCRLPVMCTAASCLLSWMPRCTAGKLVVGIRF